MSGYVYMIGCAELNAVKIGYTKHSAAARLTALQTGCAAPLDLMAFFPGSLDDERRLHMTFEPLHLQGEWFAFEGKLRDLVWYLDNPGHDRSATRQRFENAIFDCVLGEIHPDTDPNSAVSRYWEWLF